MIRWSGVIKSARVVRGGRVRRIGGGGGGGGIDGGERAVCLLISVGSCLISGMSLVFGRLSTDSDLMFDWHMILAT